MSVSNALHPSRDEEGASVVTVGGRATLPTVYVADETNSHAQRGHLRFRNCSQEEGGINTSLRSNPSYGTPGSFSSSGGPKTTPDSGVEVDESFMRLDSGFRWVPAKKNLYHPQSTDHEGSYTTAPPKYNFNKQREASMGVDSESSPFDGIKHLFGRRDRRRKNALFDNEEPAFNVDTAIMLVLILVVLGCCLFTVMTLSAGVRRPLPAKLRKSVEDMAAGSGLRGKKAAMEFAVNRKLEKLREEGRLIPEDVSMDDEGNAIGGKKAAIQYAYEITRRAEEGFDEPEAEIEPEQETDSDEIDNLEALAALLEVQPGDSEQVADKRRELVKKIGSFGHFASSKVAPAAEAAEAVEEEAAEPESEDDSEVEEEEETENEYDDDGSYVVKEEDVQPRQPRRRPAPARDPAVDATEQLRAITKNLINKQQKLKKAPAAVKKVEKKKLSKRDLSQSRRDNPFRKRQGGSNGDLTKAEDEPFRLI